MKQPIVLDSHGRPWAKQIGFIPGLISVKDDETEAGASAVGFLVPIKEDEDEQ